MGIQFHIADGALNVGGGFSTAVRTAIAAKADLIIVHGISCAAIEQPLREAKAAGIKTMGVEGFDCSDPPTNGSSLFTAQMLYAPKARTVVNYFYAWGEISAEYMIADSDGKAQYILSSDTDANGVALNNGFIDAMKKCPGCKDLADIDFTAADETPNGPLIQKLRAALIKYPNATATMMPFDVEMASAGGAAAVHELNPKVKIYGGSGTGAGLDLVRQGKVRAITGAHSAQWMGWGAMDEANRILQGKPTVPEGVGARVVDLHHNLPSKPGTAYVSPVNFEADYLKIWGVN